MSGQNRERDATLSRAKLFARERTPVIRTAGGLRNMDRDLRERRRAHVNGAASCVIAHPSEVIRHG
jgi:hypothetical protein